MRKTCTPLVPVEYVDYIYRLSETSSGPGRFNVSCSLSWSTGWVPRNTTIYSWKVGEVAHGVLVYSTEFSEEWSKNHFASSRRWIRSDSSGTYRKTFGHGSYTHRMFERRTDVNGGLSVNSEFFQSETMIKREFSRGVNTYFEVYCTQKRRIVAGTI